MQTIKEKHDLLVQEQLEVKKRKAEVSKECMALDLSLHEIKKQMHLSRGTTRHNLQSRTQQNIIDRKNNLQGEITLLNIRSKEIEIERQALSAERKKEKEASQPSNGTCEQQIINHVRDLVGLQKHYQDFSADLTRVSSMRQMAAAFSVKLSQIIERIKGVA